MHSCRRALPARALPQQQLVAGEVVSVSVSVASLSAPPCVSSCRHGMRVLWVETKQHSVRVLVSISRGHPAGRVSVRPFLRFLLLVYGLRQLRLIPFTPLRMETVMERECSALGGLFQTVIGDMKVTRSWSVVQALTCCDVFLPFNGGFQESLLSC